MSKKPKIEFFRINLESIGSDEQTFRTVINELFLNHQQSLPEEQRLNSEPDDNDLMKYLFQYFISRLDNGSVKNESKRKAFKIKASTDDQINDSIGLKSEEKIIHGIVKGGEYDTGKNLSEIDNPEEEVEKLGRNKLITDDFYFLLYTPLEKTKGILILQSYTKDAIFDIFVPFIENLFKVSRLTNKATHSLFMPLTMQEEFKNSSVIKSFVYKNHFVVDDVEDQTLQSGDFTVNVEIKSHGDQINLENLSWWRRKLGQAILGMPNQERRSLETFNTQRGYIQSNEGESNPTKFELQAENIQITATIYLSNHINLEENGVPYWEELEQFSLETLINDVLPEMYPEDYLNED